MLFKLACYCNWEVNFVLAAVAFCIAALVLTIAAFVAAVEERRLSLSSASSTLATAVILSWTVVTRFTYRKTRLTGACMEKYENACLHCDKIFQGSLQLLECFTHCV